MRAIKVFIALLFVALFAASSYGAWTTTETWESQSTPAQTLNDIDGIVTTNLATVCAVGDSGTVLVSNDYGVTWTTKTPPADVQLSAVALTGNKIFTGGANGNVYSSTNQGTSWVTVASGIDFVQGIDFWDTNNGVLVGDETGAGKDIKRTIDGGASWIDTVHLPAASTDYWRKVQVIPGTTIAYAVGASGTAANNLLKTTDSGANWTTSSTGLAIVPTALCFLDATNGFVVGESGAANTVQVYKTINGGTSWSSAGEVDIDTDAVAYDIYFANANDGWVVGKKGGNQLANIWVTSNGGTTWTTQYSNSITTNTPINAIYFTGDDSGNGWNGFAAGKGGSGIILADIRNIDLASVSPASRPQGYTGNLTLTGTNFQAGAWQTSDVAFSGTGITVNSVTRNSSTQLTVNVSIDATATASSRNVTVTNIDGSTDTLAGGFTVNALPYIDSLVPSTGTQGTGPFTVRILGTNFLPSPTVAFTRAGGTGVTAGTATYISSYEINVPITIDGTATTGTWDAQVINADTGVSNMQAFAVSANVANPPTIIGVTPNSINRGTTQTITITGTNFVAGATVAVSTNGITVGTATVVSTNEISVTLTVTAASHLGARTLIVSNPDGGAGSLNNAFWVTDPGVANPTITSLKLNYGYQGTSESVAINGTSFESGAFISFTPATGITVTNVTLAAPDPFTGEDKIVITINIDASAPTGFRKVTLFNPNGGFVELLNAYEVKTPAAQGQGTVVGNVLFNPNPAKSVNNVNLQINTTGTDIIDLYAFDITGLRVLTMKDLPIRAGNNKITILPANWNFHLANGIYCFNIVSKISNKAIARGKLAIAN